MSFLGKIFTWWNGATFGTMLWSARNGEHVGTDAQGNKYYRSKDDSAGKAWAQRAHGGERRWVIYNGANDASRVPPEWHGWLHQSYDELPESHLQPAKIWEVDYTPNATGTPGAYRPAGALERGGRRAAATGDYEAWTPDA
ncbi:NADH:ubiquinone oxidoreductase subunit NDUFA12 [Croceibacterium aestuarii]|uniref:NADH:ubiquinone oxidoreductase subunit NDUFA12 n=1 Tax=Croceibacterium aestuarii TaxID=3064139 RepID=UPI00272E32CB|nr:NADH:ubiquinone oxidoreductase subunit NDUFA12 [Croceibacterium sp. D39]